MTRENIKRQDLLAGLRLAGIEIGGVDWRHPVHDLPEERDDVLVLYVDDEDRLAIDMAFQRRGQWVFVGSMVPAYPRAWTPLPAIPTPEEWPAQRLGQYPMARS